MASAFSKLFYAERLFGPGPLRTAAGAVLLMLLGPMAGAQDAAEPPSEPPSESQDAAVPRAPAPRRPAAVDDVFVPSEEVAADQEIVFPVDI